MAGLTGGKVPRFTKQYANLRETLGDAARAFAEDVSGGAFPPRSTPSTRDPGRPREATAAPPTARRHPPSAGCRPSVGALSVGPCSMVDMTRSHTNAVEVRGLVKHFGATKAPTGST